MNHSEILNLLNQKIELDEYQSITNGWVNDVEIINGRLHVVFEYEIEDQSSYPTFMYSETCEIPASEVEEMLSTSKN